MSNWHKFSQKIPYNYPIGVHIRCEKIPESGYNPFADISFDDAQRIYNHIMNPERQIGDQVWSTKKSGYRSFSKWRSDTGIFSQRI